MVCREFNCCSKLACRRCTHRYTRTHGTDPWSRNNHAYCPGLSSCAKSTSTRGREWAGMGEYKFEGLSLPR